MFQIPKLSFLPPETFGESMNVDEINFSFNGTSLPPFKGSRFVVYPGQTSPLDVHQVKECWFIASGKGIIYYADDITMEVNQGDILYFDSNKSHQVLNNYTKDLLIFSIWWQ